MSDGESGSKVCISRRVSRAAASFYPDAGFVENGTFLVNYAARTSLDVDAMYWQTLHDKADGDGVGLLDEVARAEMELLIQMKMEQRKAYEVECSILFS